MISSKFSVVTHHNPPLGMPPKYGLLESLDGSFPNVVFYCKNAWVVVMEMVDLELTERDLREREVMASDLPEKLPGFEFMVKKSGQSPDKYLV